MVDAAFHASPKCMVVILCEKEARVEYAAAQKALDSRLSKERESLEDERLPNSELTRQP